MSYLCLTRKQGESIFIGENNEIEIIIVSSGNRSGGQVKLGIKADSSIPIMRSELLKKENDYEKKNIFRNATASCVRDIPLTTTTKKVPVERKENTTPMGD